MDDPQFALFLSACVDITAFERAGGTPDEVTSLVDTWSEAFLAAFPLNRS